MSTCTITVITENKKRSHNAEAGERIIDVLEKSERERIDTPCGGKGVCGKCLIKVEGEGCSPVTESEIKKLTQRELDEGYRLACVARITGNITIFIPTRASHMEILEKGIEYSGSIDPWVKKKHVTMEKPNLEDQRDDLRRLREAASLDSHQIDFKLLKSIPDTLRESDYSVTAVYNDQSFIAVEPGNTSEKGYGIAVDIGTTTVVLYLIDTISGKKIGVASGLNVQKSYGQDVISRINHTMNHEDGLQTLQTAIVDQLNLLIDKLVKHHRVPRENVYSMTIAGNTTMMHLLTGLPAQHIAAVPFIPAALEAMTVPARDLGIEIAPSGCIYCIPGISAYIGADITSAILSSNMAEEEPLSLLIDIGTNGEIVLGNREGLLSCSTAAGPAFEGASIRDGVGGVAGAINTVSTEGGQLHYTTIHDEAPLGICGSGIVDALSTLLYMGVVDETGRLLKKEELTDDPDGRISSRIVEDNGMAAYLLEEGSKTAHGDSILLTQKDIREVQNAKASIAAGITTLIKEAGKKADDIERVFLAGGFGSYIDKHHAVNIGLIPRELENKISVIGNAAGSGAAISMLSRQQFQRCSEIVEKTRYIELSSSPQFMEDYINSMTF